MSSWATTRSRGVTSLTRSVSHRLREMFPDEPFGAGGVLLEEEVAAVDGDQRGVRAVRLVPEPLRREVGGGAREHRGRGGQVREVTPPGRGAVLVGRHLEDGRLGVRGAGELDPAVGTIDEAPPDVRGKRFGCEDVERRSARIRGEDRGAVGPHGPPLPGDRGHEVPLALEGPLPRWW